MLSLWVEKVASGSRCINYRIFKEKLEHEFYLTKLSPQLRNAMSRYRCVYNNLPANKFKINGEEPNKNCNLCNAHDIGDEYHYLFKCTYFIEERIVYLNKYFISNPNTLKMKQLFNTRNPKNLRNLAKFQAHILSYFKNSIQA